MVQFNLLEINKENTLVYLDVVVEPADYFQNVYLDYITIRTADSEDSAPDAWRQTISGNNKSFSIALPVSDIIADTNTDLLLVSVYTKGAPDPSTPCGTDVNPSVRGLCYEYRIYNLILSCLRGMCSECCLPSEFIDMGLRYQLILLSLQAGDFKTATYYWDKFFKQAQPLKKNKCNCGNYF